MSGPLLPGSTIGVVGGGQLGRMLVFVARRMGYRTIVLDPDPAAPAGQISDAHLVASLTDVDAARELARRCDVATLEWENADLAALETLADSVPVRPGPHVLEIAQNRLLEKRTARNLGLDTAEFVPVRSREELVEGCARLGTPAILKTTTGGYDGRGQYLIREPEQANSAYDALGGGSTELILEARVDFRLEASVLCARTASGSIASFPVVENIHRNGILDFTLAPAELSDDIRKQAIRIGEALAEGLDLVGLLAVELFIDSDGRLYVNEIAPRPHNSGHYTWEACSVSQFEQQLRAVCGLPLADPILLRSAAMANLLGEHVGTGTDISAIAEALRTPMLSLHLYGKRAARPGRKMGHLTVMADQPGDAYALASRARALIQSGFRELAATTSTTETKE
jgi:5-(carboxyamino)imidazole ribonucleotide synthase